MAQNIDNATPRDPAAYLRPAATCASDTIRDPGDPNRARPANWGQIDAPGGFGRKNPTAYAISDSERSVGAKSLADLIKVAEIIDVQGNSFRHRHLSELKVASGACASDPRLGQTAQGSIGDLATPDSRYAVLAGQVLKQQPWNLGRHQRGVPIRGGGPCKSRRMAIAAISSATK